MKLARTLRPVACAMVAAAAAPSPSFAQIEVTEASIAELQEAMTTGRATSADIVRAYLTRIDAYDHDGPRLNAIIRLNPRALAEAEALDRERAATGPRGPLHGIPVLLKDNYDTHDMPTTAGTLALAGHQPSRDAFQVRRLREAGAVILGKTNLHELASGITSVSALGGQTLNPYDPTRNPGGSSGGTAAAIAASFATVGWGTDTCGSIRIPSAHNNLVGLRPTKGLSSIAGIVPLSHTQDVAGPLARTISDLALALDATVGPDASDPATVVRPGGVTGFEDALTAEALEGARIGVLDALFGESPSDERVATVVRDALATMESLGATVVPVEIPELSEMISAAGLIGHEFKWDLQDYLATAGDTPVDSLGDMIELGWIHEAIVGIMRRWNDPLSRETEASRSARAARDTLRRHVLAAMDEQGLDALAYPTIRRVAAPVGQPQPGSNCQLSAHSGMPALAMPAGWSDRLPVGLELLGRPWEDARLLALGYAFEQATDLRLPPPVAGALGPTGGGAPEVLEETVDLPGGGEAHARFAYDAVARRLAYRVEVFRIALDDIYGTVLLHTDGVGRRYVAAQLTGPRVSNESGALALTDEMVERLESGELVFELVARGDPFRVGRMQLSFGSP